MAGKVEFIGDADTSLVDERVRIIGWVHQKRNIGKIVFIVIRDRSGKIQVVFKDLTSEIMQLAQNASFEDVMWISGIVKIKNEHDENSEYEIIADNAGVISKASSLPIIPTIISETTESTRLKYRYLDLRSRDKQIMLLMRNKLFKVINNFMQKRGYIFVHTPLLSKSTPEGARDFLIPSRIYANKAYALPQSPQIYKQLLMASGIERYYQIAPSFRDEDARSDRHQEFYTIDVEASNIKGKNIISLITSLFKQIVKLVLPKEEIKKNVVFSKMKYETAMATYGTEKPDLRYDLKIENASTYFDEAMQKKLGIDKAISPLLFLKKGEQVKEIKTIIMHMQKITNQHAYQRGFSIFWFNKMKSTLFVHKYANGEGRTKSVSMNYEDIPTSIVDNVVIIPKWHAKAINEWKKYSILSKIREYWGKKYLLDDESPKFAFVWITEFPMFEIEKESGAITTCHHPFTQPASPISKDMIGSKQILNLKSTSYDIVCNGYELGSGSERIRDIQTQKQVFECLGMSEKEVKGKYGYLLNSMKHGIPPHAGMGLGFERILMVLLNKNNIRDVIPFPKTSDGFELMTNSPNKIDVKKKIKKRRT